MDRFTCRGDIEEKQPCPPATSVHHQKQTRSYGLLRESRAFRRRQYGKACNDGNEKKESEVHTHKMDVRTSSWMENNILQFRPWVGKSYVATFQKKKYIWTSKRTANRKFAAQFMSYTSGWLWYSYHGNGSVSWTISMRAWLKLRNVSVYGCRCQSRNIY